MKFIKQVNDGDIEALKGVFNKCNLPGSLPDTEGEELTLEQIGGFVYRHCESLIPERLINLLKTLDALNKSNKYEEFKEDLIKDLILNIKVKHMYAKTINEKLYVERNSGFIKKTVENINELYGIEKFNVESVKLYSKDIDNGIKDFFSLSESGRPNKAKNRKNDIVVHVDIPCIAINFIIYAGITYTRFHEDWHKFILNNYEKLEEHEDVFMKLVDECSEYRDIELWLFENAYNIQLIKDIIRNTKDICEDDLNKVYKHLSLSCLLGNLNSRGTVIELLTQNKKLIVRDEDEFGNGYGNQYYNEAELNIWIDTVKDIILQMAFFTVPIMELYLFYLIYQDEAILNKLELYQCKMLRKIDKSKEFDMDNFNFMWKRFNQIYKICDDQKLGEAFYEIEYESKKEDDKLINIINEMPENKCMELVNEYKEYFK